VAAGLPGPFGHRTGDTPLRGTQPAGLAMTFDIQYSLKTPNILREPKFYNETGVL